MHFYFTGKLQAWILFYVSVFASLVKVFVSVFVQLIDSNFETWASWTLCLGSLQTFELQKEYFTEFSIILPLGEIMEYFVKRNLCFQKVLDLAPCSVDVFMWTFPFSRHWHSYCGLHSVHTADWNVTLKRIFVHKFFIISAVFRKREMIVDILLLF